MKYSNSNVLQGPLPPQLDQIALAAHFRASSSCSKQHFRANYQTASETSSVTKGKTAGMKCSNLIQCDL